MPYTVPKSWVPGEVITDADLNKFVRDNVAYLKDHESPTGEVKMFAGNAASVPAGFLLCDGSAILRTTYADLLAVLTFTRSGNTTNGSAVVTGLSSTADLRVGAKVEAAAGIPANAVIDSIDSGSQITLSAAATATGARVLTFFPFGNGNGTTTFNVPDMRSRFGLGGGQGASLTNRRHGETGGVEAKSLSTAELAAHTHGVGSHTHDVQASDNPGATPGYLAGGSSAGTIHTETTSAAGGTSGSTGSSTAFSIMPPYLALNFMIKT